MTNQILFGANYFNQLFHDFNNSFNTKTLGLFLSPDATNHGQPILGSPSIAITGFEQIGITPPEGRSDLTWHLTDIASLSTGNHQFRFGGEIRQGRVDEFYHRHGTGAFAFDGSQGPWDGPTGCGAAVPTTACAGLSTAAFALADFLAGDVSTSSIAVGNPERFVKVNAFNFFAGDNWQITKKLNLNLGLRYEYFGPLHSSGVADLGVFVSGKGLQVQGNGINSIFPPDKNNFAPRVGFAYQPLNRGDLVVRGGVGVFYDQINMNPFLDYRPASPFADGLENNPIGPHASSVYNRAAYNWQTAQAGGASIFPGVVACTDPFCANAPGLRVFRQPELPDPLLLQLRLAG